MTRLIRTFFFTLFLCCNLVVFAQEDTTETAAEETTKTDTSSNSKLPILHAGVGLTSYKGDIGQLNAVGFVEYLLPTYKLGASYSFYDWIGIGLYGQYGTIGNSERTRPRSANFKTNFIGGNLQLNLLLANDVIFKKSSSTKPYLIGGISFYNYTAKGDLFDSNGDPYYYWTDGSIRNLPEVEDNVGVAQEINRDFDFETNYNDMFGLDPFTLAYEVGVGFEFVLNHWVTASTEVTYSFVDSDGMDGIEAGSANDGFFDASLGLNFNLAKFKSKDKDENKNEYSDVDFDALFKQDMDADGVLDIDDRCQNTPQDVEVDLNGCAKDKDNDGVPDYKDEEIESPEGAFVNESGVQIPDSVRATQLAKDTIATLREEMCEFYPSMCNTTEDEIEYQVLNTGSAENIKIKKTEGMPIEEVVKLADTDKDGVVKTKEIYELIDKFFSGETELQMIDLHHLVDYYFEQ